MWYKCGIKSNTANDKAHETHNNDATSILMQLSCIHAVLNE